MPSSENPGSRPSRSRRGASPRLFLSRFEEVGGTPLRPTKRRSLEALLQTVVQEREIKTAVLARDLPERESILSVLQAAGVEVGVEMEKADLGVTGVSAAVGKTGSILLAWDGGEEHLLTSLPPVHLVVVRAEQIYPTMEDAMESILDGGDPPAFVSIVNGPSKTGDIELIHVTGVHGPQWVYAVVI